MTRTMLTVAEQIRRARKAKGWTQAELAERCGLAQWTVSRIESEQHPSTRGLLQTIAEALDIEIVIAPEDVT